MIGIYKITNPLGKVYIGQSINIKKRFKNYRCMCTIKTQRLLYQSFLDYGVKSHIFEIIKICEKHELNDAERLYQEMFNCVTDGLNIRLTTSKTKPGYYSAESRQIMSDKQKGQLNHMFGKTGNKHPGFGRKATEETKALLSKKRLGVKKTAKHKINIGISQLGELNHQAKLVLNLQTGIYYGCVKDAAASKGINKYTLSDWLNKRKGNTNKSSFIFA